MPSRLIPFAGWVWAALAAALEPRSCANTPVGINFVLLGYGYTQGDVAFDATSPIEDAKVHVHAGLADPLLRISVNVYGAPAISMAKFPTYRQDTIVGVSPHLRVLPRSLGRTRRHLLRLRAHDHRRGEGAAAGERTSGPDRGRDCLTIPLGGGL
jgi:hypothetical protein